MRVAVWFSVCLALLVVPSQSLTAQTLERFEDQFHKDRAASPPETRTGPPQADDDAVFDDDCDNLDNVLTCLLFRPLAELFTMPFTATFTGLRMRLSQYPYQRPDGNYAVAPSADGARTVAVNVSASYHLLDSRTRGLAKDVRLRTSARVGTDLDAIRYQEDSPAPNATLNFAAGYLMLTPSESDEHMLDFGFGAMALSGRDRRVGPAFTLHYLWTPLQPWSMDLKGSVGSIQEHALWDLRGRVGVHIGPIELFGGFRSLRGPREVLNGPEVGVAMWF